MRIDLGVDFMRIDLVAPNQRYIVIGGFVYMPIPK